MTPLTPVELAQPPPGVQARSLLVARNALMLTFGQIIVQVSAVLIGILVARVLGQEAYGRYSLAFAFAAMFGLLFYLATDTLMIREIARDPSPAGVWGMLSAGLWIRVVCFPLALAVITGGAWIAGYDGAQVTLIVLAALALGLSITADLARAALQGLQRMDLDTLARAVEKLTALLLAAAVILLTRSLPLAVAMILSAALVGLLVSAGLLIRLAGQPGTLAPRPNASLRLLRLSLPWSGSMLVIAMYQQLPVVILSQYALIHEVGLYNAANGVVAPFLLLPVAFGTALLPALTRQRAGLRAFLSLLALTVAIALTVMGGLLLLGDWPIRVLFGAAFIDAYAVLPWLTLLVVPEFVTAFLINFLIAHDQQRWLPFGSVTSLALTVVLCLLLIPPYGMLGAALARVIATTGGTSVMVLFALRALIRRGNGQTKRPDIM
jgi:O-antigen/teichoic acid export membrane protein